MTPDELLQLIEQADREQWTELDLRDRGLAEIPAEIGCLDQLQQLSLSSSPNSKTPNVLDVLPPEIGELNNLLRLYLSSISLRDLPSEIGNLHQLQTLYLSGNRLSSLPLELTQLKNLRLLSIRAIGLSIFPSVVTEITSLQTLFADNNGLVELEADIGNLINLRFFDIGRNSLSKLPEEIGKLVNLLIFRLESNELTSLPQEICELTKLKHLNIRNNQLKSLPTEVANLTQLHTLNLHGNEFAEVPAAIFSIARLQKLNIGGNNISELPKEIGLLADLRALYLAKNELHLLPPEIGKLTKLRELDLGRNPWQPPFDELVKGPRDQLFAYFRSLTKDTPQYEAKVLLVGEGAVGKSSLLRALRNEPFDPKLSTTHGIEIKTVEESHPHENVEDNLILNFWDFGGQEVYRITHQFFFSRHALFLLVWKPREGREENALESWLERIHLRVGDDARVLIIATHCSERNPDLDYPALKAKYPRLLAGHLAIDSKDGTGIDELHDRIAEVVAEMEYVGTPFNRRWLDTRDELKEMDRTHVTYDEFVGICAGHQLSATDAAALIGILHTLGHIVYYDADGLRDFVVLNPSWLTKAIGYILEDTPTLAGGGVLDHHRLAAIWRDHGDPKRDRYDARYFPYFLRLMEEYDVSVRLVDCEASLVPQMVPHERPDFSWSATGGELTLVCALEQNPPGLVAWTTARNHRWSVGKHWRSGVFFQHEDGHEALIDYTSRLNRRLTLTVRGEYPAHFMHLLQDGLEALIRERWPYLDYLLYVPCPTLEDNLSCNGVFPLKTLYKARVKGRNYMPCQTCLEDVSVGRLLIGYVTPDEPLSQQLADMETRRLAADREASLERQQIFHEASHERQQIMAQSAEMTRRVLRAILSEARNGPRLFLLSPIDFQRRWDPRNLMQEELRLTLCCEHPGQEHELKAEGQIRIRNARAWVGRVTPYALLSLKVLRIALPVAIGAAGVAEEAIKDQYEADLKFTNSWIKAANEFRDEIADAGDHVDHLDYPSLSRAEGAGLRAFHQLLASEHGAWQPGDATIGPTVESTSPDPILRRVVDKKTGDILWVCPRHYKEYDPGLPKIPVQI